MKKTINILAITLISTCVFSKSLLAGQTPRALATDTRIRQVMYSPDEVYEITSTYGFQTAIEFSPKENIQVASVGDSIAWQVMPAQSRLFIKPVEEDAVTNLTVITDQRTYYFSLIALRSKALGSNTYLVRFQYPETSPIFEGLSSSPKEPTELNFNYKIKKAKKTGLIRIFDDGEFTYLQFQKGRELPAIFSVQEGGKEALVNYRMQGPYVVIERVLLKITLRRGKSKTRLVNQAFNSTHNSKPASV